MRSIKNGIMVCLLIVTMQACTQNTIPQGNDNTLLADIVKVKHLQSIVDKKNLDWMSGINVNQVYDIIIDPIMQLEKDVYYPDAPLGAISSTVKTREEIRADILKNCVGGTCPKEEFYKIYFLEEWNFNKKQFSMKKDVVAYMPVRRFIRNGGEEVHQAVFHVVQEEESLLNNKKRTKIGTNLISEFEFNSKEYSDEAIGLDKIKFINYIFDGIINKDIKPYEPTYLVDNSKTTFPSLSDLEILCGESLVSNTLRSKISSLVFIEDWFVDEETLFIYKKVNGIGFLKTEYNWQTKKTEKNILFFIFFD